MIHVYHLYIYIYIYGSMTGKMTTPPVYLPNKPLGLQATYLCEPIQ